MLYSRVAGGAPSPLNGGFGKKPNEWMIRKQIENPNPPTNQLTLNKHCMIVYTCTDTDIDIPDIPTDS